MIPVFGSSVGKDELREVQACLESQWLGNGARTQTFEGRFADRLGLDNFLFVDSGSNALYMAVELLALPPGSEIIVPTFTWVACAQAVLLAGHRPVFCDVDLETQNVTADTIAAQVTPLTRAVMVVHYAGKPVDMGPVLDLGFPVIEDAAHAVDSRIQDRACGGIGDVGIYSFDPVKNLTTGGGGGVTARNPALLERGRKLRHSGISKSGFEASQSEGKTLARWWEYDISDVFIRMLPSDVAAAIGLAQLDRLDRLQKKRLTVWQRYQRAFRDADWIQTPAEPGPGERHSYFTYFIRVPNRDSLAHLLFDKGIYTKLDFHPLHLNGIYQSDTVLPVAEILNETGLNIPLHPRLTDDEVQFVIDSILAAHP
jgi:dTDP-4-amino-4,6-dideoxygalactose transaminase